MSKILIFVGGFVAGVLATIFAGYLIAKDSVPSEGLSGLTLFPDKGDCITTTSRSKSSEIDIFQVLAPDAALANIRYYTDKKMSFGEVYRDYDIENEVVVLLINSDNKTYYDDQKIEVTDECVRQVGTYQYQTRAEFGKTVPVVVIE